MYNKITLIWNPLSTQHIYWQRWKFRFMKKDAKERKEEYIETIKNEYKWNVLENDIELVIKLYFGDKRRRDIDNYHKLSLDSMSWLVYVDDVQIKRMIVEKYYDKENARIEVEFKEIKFVDIEWIFSR